MTGLRAPIVAGLVVAVGVGFGAAWAWRDHTAAPRRIKGTVTWSNEDAQRLVFEAGKSADSGEYQTAITEWVDAKQVRTVGHWPSCLAPKKGSLVRTDRRPAEIDVISAELSGATYRVVVAIHCL
ncbi:hypothetical protein [Actinoplanes sp. L3-i22]|uniref:hypothetical protein n=1 Tax=Actinoplanes sp. L3-i22 TaxID=2836373 RepID=UPI001C74FEAF|nr:hypothetical protein [Actinoplanes sp. L3-i22]BCY08647.1 hypothetical protein L3i22_037350 [Actinoplanes sp. L3-i22]